MIKYYQVALEVQEGENIIHKAVLLRGISNKMIEEFIYRCYDNVSEISAIREYDVQASKEYKFLNERKKATNLMIKILRYCNGYMNREQLEICTCYVQNLNIDIDNLYIRFIDNATRFATELTLVDNTMEHNYYGSYSSQENYINIINAVECGEKYTFSYSNNGDVSTDERKKEPNFNIDDFYVGLKINHCYSNYDNECYNKFYYTLLIYRGNGQPFKYGSNLIDTLVNVVYGLNVRE